MLTYVACLLSCVIVAAIPTGPDEVVYPSIETFRDGKKSVTFRAFGQDINLRLQPAGKFISKDFSVVDGAGNEIHEPEFDLESFKQKLYRDKRNGASLYIDDDGPLHIYGIVNSKLRIEPQNTIENGKRAHLVFETREDKTASFKDKAIPAGIMRKENQKDEQRYYNCIIIKYVFITESSFTESFPRNNVTMKQYLAVSILGVQRLIDTLGLNITINLYGIIILTTKTEPYMAPYLKECIIPGHECIDAGKLLDKMSEYYSDTKISKIINCAIVMLITRKKLCSEDDGILSPLAGIAFTGGLCEEQWKFGISHDDKDEQETEDTIAHESAHLIGCPHDGDGPVESIKNSPGSKKCYKTGYIMDTEGGPKKNRNKFSPCCIRNVKNMLTLEQSDCVKEVCFDEGDYYDEEDYYDDE